MWLRKRNVKVSAISEMADNPPDSLVLIIQSVIDQVNKNILDQATAIQRWKVLPRDFSIPTGELSKNWGEADELQTDRWMHMRKYANLAFSE